MRALTIFILVLLPVISFAQTVKPLGINEFAGGAMCAIDDGKGGILVGDAVKVGETLIRLKQYAVTKKSKTWKGKDTEVTFKVLAGKLLEGGDGSFSVGDGPSGTLSVVHRGVVTEIEGREVCFGPD